MLTWPLVTVWGFMAQPDRHIFLNPLVTRRAPEAWATISAIDQSPRGRYRGLLDFAETIRGAIGDLHPRDFIDLQSFIWVQGSDEFPD